MLEWYSTSSTKVAKIFPGECMEKFKGSNKYRPWSKYNNEDDCVDNDGEWLEFTNYLERAPKYTSKSQCEAASNPSAPHVWARPMGQVELECLVALPPLDCKLSEWSRDNHLGNGMSGEALQYNWELPYFPSGQKQRCVVRLRYKFEFSNVLMIITCHFQVMLIR